MIMKSINVQELKNLINNDKPFTLIDVREQAEYDLANINGILIPTSEFANRFQEVPKEGKVIVQCRSGQRSANVIMWLEHNHGVHIFGESHGESVGIVIDGCPAGLSVDEGLLLPDLERRKGGLQKGTTPRKEDDLPIFKSGIFNGKTTGAPISIFFENNNTRSEDYIKQRAIPRPGHADFVATVKYGGYEDYRGGGHFSARLTTGVVSSTKGVSGFSMTDHTPPFAEFVTMLNSARLHDTTGAEICGLEIMVTVPDAVCPHSSVRINR
ncbi:putative chorismate synthase [Ancylostoma ceylanicum]|uniref:chorismate synthase n=1 Tax=Ancylostoma ceylanicum TaxID=53326 RepID=A0A0D6LD98_9BILA|nr:putative chorismate synthase [Ancylostoma ceylanicum]